MTSFYVELSSNASYETNTVANFKNKIQLISPLKDQWEVGLVEISYTKSWKNLREPFNIGFETLYDNHIIKKAKKESKTIGYYPTLLHNRKGVVRDGYYDSIHDLLKEISLEFDALKEELIEVQIVDKVNTNPRTKYLPKKINEYPTFHYDNIRKLVFIQPGKYDDGSLIVPNLNGEILNLLGFDKYSSYKSKNINDLEWIYADRPADMNANLKTLYVYSDIVEPQYVGDSRTKLLKTVEVPDYVKYGDQVFINYNNPHYVPLLINEFEKIEIDIKDDTDTRIPFMFGRTRLKLHFRQCLTHT